MKSQFWVLQKPWFLLGDGWSIMSSERSDEKRTEKIVLKSLSRAQGWTHR
jgi:hypothetical protein